MIHFCQEPALLRLDMRASHEQFCCGATDPGLQQPMCWKHDALPQSTPEHFQGRTSAADISIPSVMILVWPRCAASAMAGKTKRLFAARHTRVLVSLSVHKPTTAGVGFCSHKLSAIFLQQLHPGLINP